MLVMRGCGSVRGRTAGTLRAPHRYRRTGAADRRGITRFMPEKAAEDAERSADSRHFTIDHQQVSFGGTASSPASRPRRRPRPRHRHSQGREPVAHPGVDRLPRRTPLHRGRPARPQPLALDLATETDEEAGRTTGDRRPKPRQVVLHVHLSDTAITGTRVGGAGAGGEPAPNPHRRPDPHLVRQPRHRGHREAGDRPERTHPRRRLRVPDRLREQVTLRDHTCVFPWCTRSARKTGCRPRHPLRRRRHHQQRQHRATLPTTSSTENTLRVELHDARTRVVPLVEPARLPVPARPPRHPRRQSRPARP